MRAASRRLAVVITMLLTFAALASPALAAPPGNDTFTNATIANLGFTEVLDTTEATTDADDDQLNATCGAPSTAASVWYAFTPASDIGVIVDVSSSDYSAGVLVGTGTEGALETVACGPGTVGFFATAGTTYYVLAIDDQSDGAGNGGQLSISFLEAPPPPTLDVTVNRTGTVNTRTGVATVSGTFTCTDGDFIDVFVEARQNVGRFTIIGSGGFFEAGSCDGAPHPWSAEIYSENGKFAGGRAIALAFSIACGPLECAEGFTEQTVMLRGTRK